MKKYSIGQFSKEIGVTPQTLRNWDKTDKLKPSHISPSGHRYYSQQQVDSHLNLKILSSKSHSGESCNNTLDILIQILMVFSTSLDSVARNKVNKFIRELKEDEQ